MHSRFQSTETDTDTVDRAALDIVLKALVQRFKGVRQRSLELCHPLHIEDFGVQPMADASPPKCREAGGIVSECCNLCCRACGGRNK